MSEPIKLPFVLDPNTVEVEAVKVDSIKQRATPPIVPQFLIPTEKEKPQSLELSQVIDIDDQSTRDQIAETMLADIDDFSWETMNDGHRDHLGGSLIGKPCSRELWYSFRWVKQQTFTENGAKRHPGQLMRLFQRGHNEEEQLVKYLKGIGCTFEATKEQQIRISDCGGHFGGSLDNVGMLPPKFNIPYRVLFEFKTSNMAEFNKLKKHGLRRHKPIHFSQMCIYGFKTNIKYGCYVVVDKNTDELYIEISRLDFNHAQMLLEKANHIIQTTQPPQKIATTPAHFSCKWCSFKNVCHHNEPYDKNCRSCNNSIPLEDGKWGCKLYGEIPKSIIPVGCDNYVEIGKHYVDSNPIVEIAPLIEKVPQ